MSLTVVADVEQALLIVSSTMIGGTAQTGRIRCPELWA